MKRIVCAAIACAFAATAAAQAERPSAAAPSRFPKGIKHLQQQKAPSANWLLDADDDTERFRRLQTALGGSDLQMLLVGQRFEGLQLAIARNNPEMGLYHLRKMRDYMNVMGMKRPFRTPNLESMFLESGVWQAMEDALLSGDPERMRSRFAAMRETCMACHIAEKVGFLNDSAVFSATAEPAAGKR